MGRQDEAVLELEAAVADLRTEIERCPEAEWHTELPNGWTRATVALHCAMGNDTGTAWLAFLATGRDILDTAEFNDLMNARVAERTRLATREEAMDTLARTTERAAHYIRSLTDEELDRPALFRMSQRDVTAARFLPGLARHIRQHTEQFKAGL